MSYKKSRESRIIDFEKWAVNPASYILDHPWEWERYLLEVCDITQAEYKEVSRITGNRCRIDNASESKQTCFGTMDEGMLKRILEIDLVMRVVSTTIGFYDGGSQNAVNPLAGIRAFSTVTPVCSEISGAKGASGSWPPSL